MAVVVRLLLGVTALLVCAGRIRDFERKITMPLVPGGSQRRIDQSLKGRFCDVHEPTSDTLGLGVCYKPARGQPTLAHEGENVPLALESTLKMPINFVQGRPNHNHNHNLPKTFCI